MSLSLCFFSFSLSLPLDNRAIHAHGAPPRGQIGQIDRTPTLSGGHRLVLTQDARWRNLVLALCALKRILAGAWVFDFYCRAIQAMVLVLVDGRQRPATHAGGGKMTLDHTEGLTSQTQLHALLAAQAQEPPADLPESSLCTFGKMWSSLLHLVSLGLSVSEQTWRDEGGP